MRINPYYFTFCVVYRYLKRINVQKDGIFFSTYAVLFLLFVPHFFIFLFSLKDLGILGNINIPKYFFGISFSLSFWLLNYFLFEFRNKYTSIVNSFAELKRNEIYLNITLLFIYFSIPFFLFAYH